MAECHLTRDFQKVCGMKPSRTSLELKVANTINNAVIFVTGKVAAFL